MDDIDKVTREQFIAHMDGLIDRMKKRGVSSMQALGMDLMRENALQTFDEGKRVVFMGRRYMPDSNCGGVR